MFSRQLLPPRRWALSQSGERRGPTQPVQPLLPLRLAGCGAEADACFRRQVAVPANRMTPLKEHWMEIYKPVTENLKVDMRMNLKTKRVRLRHCHQPYFFCQHGRKPAATVEEEFMTDMHLVRLGKVELKTGKATEDPAALQKATDFVQAFILGALLPPCPWAAAPPAVALLRRYLPYAAAQTLFSLVSYALAPASTWKTREPGCCRRSPVMSAAENRRCRFLVLLSGQGSTLWTRWHCCDLTTSTSSASR